MRHLCTCALLLLVATAGACRHATEPQSTLREYLPALHYQAVGAVPFDVRGLQGKVVLVSVDATWCFPCVADLPVLVKMQRELGPKGLQVIQVGWDFEGRKVLKPYADSYELPFPVLPATELMRSGQSPFGPIRQIPSRFLFGRNGTLTAAWAGLADPKSLLKAVEREVATSP